MAVDAVMQNMWWPCARYVLQPGSHVRQYRHPNSNHWRLRHLLWNCPNMNVTGLHWWSANISSGNGLVLSGNKPLPEPMLTQICRHMASLGHNELTLSVTTLNEWQNGAISWTISGSNFKFNLQKKKTTVYLTLTSELWCVYCEYLGEKNITVGPHSVVSSCNGT